MLITFRDVSPRCARALPLTLCLLAGLAACDGRDRGPDAEQSGPLRRGACANHCRSTGRSQNPRQLARCYSCMCEQALGELPPASLYSADQAAAIEIYRYQPGGDPDVVPITNHASRSCLNPSRLSAVSDDASCYRNSRLGYLNLSGNHPVTGRYDTHFFTVYRKKDIAALGNPNRYDDFGIIGHNTVTGATCFWDDIDGQITDGTRMPEIKVHEASNAVLDASVTALAPTDGSACISCHDNNPFIYTPYLRSQWPMARASAWTMSDYKRVTFGGELAPVQHRFLVNYAGQGGRSCIGCHRIADSATRSFWAMDGLGSNPRSTQQEVPAGASTEARSFRNWMPPGGRAADNGFRACMTDSLPLGGDDITVNGCRWMRGPMAAP